MKKGAFITLYGINNIGKSTHSKRLVKRLIQEGHEVAYLKYPIYDLEPTGPKINEILRGGTEQKLSEEELQTLFVQNRKDFEPQLRAALEEGKIVIAEDYTQSGIAWGAAKGLDEKLSERLNEGLLKEDFSLLMVGARVMNAREEQHIHETDDVLVEKVGQILRRRAADQGWAVVELQPKQVDTAKMVWEAVEKFLADFYANNS